MNPAFQEGRRPPTNTTASLANTGHPPPLGRRPATGTVRAGYVGPAGRPGPRPMSAQQLARANAAQSHTKRMVDQVVRLTADEVNRSNSQLRQRMERMPHSTYDARTVYKPHRVDEVDTNNEPTGRERYVVGKLWVFASTLNDAYGTRRYWVYNSLTGVVISFEPERGVSAKNRTYMLEKDQFRNIAAGTGVVGGHLEKGFTVVAGGMLTGGLLWEAGLLGVIGTAVRAYVVDASKGALLRMSVDFAGQFGVGMITGEGDLEKRARLSIRDVNWSSVAAAGVLNTEKLGKYAKLLAAFGSAVATNAYAVKGSNMIKYGSYGHMVNLHDQQEKKEFLLNVILSTAFDQAKEYGAAWLEKSGRNTLSMGWVTAAKYNRFVPRAPSSVVDQTQVAVLNFQIGMGMETIKKFWEDYQTEKTEAAKKRPPTK